MTISAGSCCRAFWFSLRLAARPAQAFSTCSTTHQTQLAARVCAVCVSASDVSVCLSQSTKNPMTLHEAYGSKRVRAGQTLGLGSRSRRHRPPRERWEEARGGRRPQPIMEDPPPDDAGQRWDVRKKNFTTKLPRTTLKVRIPGTQR